MVLRLLTLVAVFAACAAAQSVAYAQSTPVGNSFIISTIEGRVTGPDGKAIDRALVRLIDEGGIREAGRVYTDSSGRYRFEITAGNFVVEVQPTSRPDLATQRQDVLVNPAPNARNGERIFVNFFLKPAAAELVAPRGPRFDQEVPPEAAREYDRALKTIGGNKEEAYAALRNALQAYPDYYAALELLGTAYVKDDHLDEAMLLLQHAVKVNPQGERSHYGLGVAYYKKNRFDLAVEAFKRADAIVPEDANTLMYLGLSQVRAGQKDAAEPTLKRAYSLGAKNVPELHLALAKIFIDAQRYKEAAAELRMLLKETPNLKDKDKIKALIDKYEKM